MAIGIGDMTVTSYINQPLQANITVLQPDGLLESEVIASLASPGDFDRLGLERHYSLNSLRFAANLLQTVLSSGDEGQREHAQSLLDSLE
jgi:Tfp pilus assembly protein FimV